MGGGSAALYRYDDFDDNNLDARWTETLGEGSVVEQNQRVELTAPAGGWQRFGQQWDGTIDVDSIMPIQIPSKDNSGNLKITSKLWTTSDPGSGWYGKLELWWDASAQLYKVKGGWFDGDDLLYSSTRNLTSMTDSIWIRSRYKENWGDTTITFYYNFDGGNDWYQIETAQTVPLGNEPWQHIIRLDNDQTSERTIYVTEATSGAGVSLLQYAQTGTSATIDGESIEIAEQVVQKYGNFMAYIDGSGNLKIKQIVVSENNQQIGTGASHL